MTKLGKKGQVTMFIIAGVIILFIAFFIGYVQNQTFRQKVESSLFGGLVVPEQAKGVVNYVDGCIQDIAEEGVNLLGNQAGYIELPEVIETNPRSYLDIVGISVPYWLYGEGNVKIPSKEEMEFQLKEYIEGRFGECDLDQFKARGYGFSNEEINVDVGIGDDEVIIRLESDFEVDVKEKTYDVKDYILVTLNRPLGKLWSVARDVVERELRNKPLEFNTLNLISVYSKDKDYFPPIAGFDFKCGGRSWTYTQTKERAQGFLSSYLPYLRVEGSKNEKGARDEFYKSMVINGVSSTNLDDVDIGFNYFEDWPMFFDIYPREGELLKAGGLNLNVPFFGLLCNNIYNFRYTMLYPILVTLEEEDYSFKMALEVYLVDNYGRESLFGDTSDSKDLYTPQSSLFCEEDQKLSGDVILGIRDGITNQEVDEAQIRYVCGFSNCVVGESISNGAFIDKFPLCKGGELIIEKEGYATYRERFDASVESGGGREISLEPFRKKKLSVKIFNIEEGVLGAERDLREGEEVHLEISKINADLLGFDKQEVFDIKKGDETEIEIVPGDYVINARLNLDKKIILPQEEIEGVNFEGIELEGAMIGGIKISNFYLDKENLDTSEEIIINLVSYGEPKNVREVSANLELEGFDLQPNLI